jgi:hypothetical protein
MKLSRHSRFMSALLALASMLFMQLAVAGYVCPNMQIAQAMGAIAMQAAVIDHADMAGCEGLESGQPAQCKTQAQIGQQSLDKQDPPRVSPFVALPLMLATAYPDPAYQTPTTEREAVLLTRTTAPPLSIQNCCFRI